MVCCACGDEIGKHAAPTLCSLDFDAAYLEGGIAGWIAAGLPTVVRHSAWNTAGNETHHSRWITRARFKIDRLACPWLVQQFIDPYASFFYVPAAEVRSQALALQAEPYDIPGVKFSHYGNLCSFDAFLAEFDLHDPALNALAAIVRAADIAQLQAVLQAAGLLAISLGLGATISDDDALLETAIPMYDALYAWCKTATHETHNWPFDPNLHSSLKT